MASSIILIIFFSFSILGFILIGRFVQKRIKEGKELKLTTPITFNFDTKDKNNKLVEENRTKGIFGPTSLDKIGGSIAYGLLIIILNAIVFNAPYKSTWWFKVLFNLFWWSLIYLAFFRVNVRIKNGILSYRPEYKKYTALVSEIVSVKRLYASGYRGMPTPILSLEVPGRKNIEVSIEKWTMPEIITLIKYLKELNKKIIIDNVFGPLLNAASPEEFKAAQKAYSKQETKGILRFGIVALASMAFFCILWLLANHFKN